MLCKDVMETDIETLSKDDTAEKAAIAMRDSDVGFLPVVDERGKPIGAVTDRDIVVRVIAAGKPYDSKIDDFMTRDVVTVRAFEDLAEAHERMAEHQISRMICTDELGRLSGVISLADLADVDEEETGETLQEVKAPAPMH